MYLIIKRSTLLALLEGNKGSSETIVLREVEGQAESHFSRAVVVSMRLRTKMADTTLQLKVPMGHSMSLAVQDNQLKLTSMSYKAVAHQ